MFKFKISIIFFTFLFSVSAISFADIKTDLNIKKNELNRLHKDISNKKAEKEKLVREEKKVKKELQNILKSIEKNEKELKFLERKISNTEKNLQIASDQYYKSDMSKQQYKQVLNEQYLLYTKKKVVSYFSYLLEFKIMQNCLKENSNRYNVEKNKSLSAKSDINKYTKAKTEYEKLKKDQQKLIQKNKKLQKNKNNLLKTTAGKRVKAEQDIKELNNSEKALKALVNKLMKASQDRDKTRSLRAINQNVRRNNLPWPVNGELILKYGKNKHPDLDTNVISNGIKIKAQDYASIKAVDEGTVVFVGEFRSYGKMVIVDHKGVFFGVYGQLNKILVKEDQKVIKQQEIAKLGRAENSILYFEIRQLNVPENPLLWLMER